MSDPSPYVSTYMSRKQAEALWTLLHAQPQKKWRPVEKSVLTALRANAGNKIYVDGCCR